VSLVGQLASEFGWTNGFGLFLPPLDKTKEIGFGFQLLERLATMYSLRSQLSSLLGMNFGSEVPCQHLLQHNRPKRLQHDGI
jgi:hypothetical protein